MLEYWPNSNAAKSEQIFQRRMMFSFESLEMEVVEFLQEPEKFTDIGALNFGH